MFQNHFNFFSLPKKFEILKNKFFIRFVKKLKRFILNFLFASTM